MFPIVSTPTDAQLLSLATVLSPMLVCLLPLINIHDTIITKKPTAYIMAYSVFSILFGVDVHLSIVTVEYFHCFKSFVLCLFMHPSPLQFWSFYCLHSLAFFRMSSSWKHTIHSKIAFSIGFFLSVRCIWSSSMFLHGLIALFSVE